MARLPDMAFCATFRTHFIFFVFQAVGSIVILNLVASHTSLNWDVLLLFDAVVWDS